MTYQKHLVNQCRWWAHEWSPWEWNCVKYKERYCMVCKHIHRRCTWV
jgi:hypothetical protein